MRLRKRSCRHDCSDDCPNSMSLQLSRPQCERSAGENHDSRPQTSWPKSNGGCVGVSPAAACVEQRGLPEAVRPAHLRPHVQQPPAELHVPAVGRRLNSNATSAAHQQRIGSASAAQRIGSTFAVRASAAHGSAANTQRQEQAHRHTAKKRAWNGVPGYGGWVSCSISAACVCAPTQKSG